MQFLNTNVNNLLCAFKDQIDHLYKQKIVASTINSKMSSKERIQVVNDLKCKCPRTQLLYVTPEQANTHTFKVTHFVITYCLGTEKDGYSFLVCKVTDY
jgi:superfamily II DNA helicase RecQ